MYSCKHEFPLNDPSAGVVSEQTRQTAQGGAGVQEGAAGGGPAGTRDPAQRHVRAGGLRYQPAVLPPVPAAHPPVQLYAAHWWCLCAPPPPPPPPRRGCCPSPSACPVSLPCCGAAPAPAPGPSAPARGMVRATQDHRGCAC